MLYNTNKERGNAGMSLAIAYFGANGYTVSVPLNDTQDYDLIVDKSGVLESVQIKFTSQRDKKSGNYVCYLRSMGGTKGTVYKRVKDTDIELLFVVCSDKTMYLIPKSYITQSSQLILYSETEKYKVEI